ncbi:class I SAM-dependent methyltransferase [Bacteroides sp.]|uniref:class I SAM-dependent methyltransferase n=1 Tax=Bacteroides sp. TaxID=29523 RepID=UPI0025C30BA6|nr:class I SAM-dependent methyltransferase [Bacteroides sp.]
MEIANKISIYNRNRKYIYFEKNIKYTPSSKILDVGFTNTISDNGNYIEKNYPYPENITALGVDGKNEFEKQYPNINTILYDGNIFPFPDNSFDIGWSSAVIEHVGNREKQLLFLKELLRTCKTTFLTTPNIGFPVEVHTRTFFLHWLPNRLFEKYLILVGKSWATGDYMHLLSKKNIINLCREAGASKITIHGNRILGLVLDYSIIIEK